MPSFALIMTGLKTISMKSANILMRWLWKELELIFENCKANDRASPPQTALREGAELHSPRDMFLGLSLRFKSVLRNSGRIYLAAARMETSPHSSSTTERARLPHFNEATCGFRSPALAGRIDFKEIEFRGKTRRRAVLRIRNALLNIIIAIIPQIEF